MSVSDSGSFSPEVSSYEDIWRKPEVQELLSLHLIEQLQAGIFSTYNTAVAEAIVASEAYGPGEVKEAIQSVTSAELPLVIAADCAGDVKGPTIMLATPLALFRVDSRTGESLYSSFLSVAEVKEGVVKQLHNGFTQDQAELLLRQGNEQIGVGVHPQQVYDGRYISNLSL